MGRDAQTAGCAGPVGAAPGGVTATLALPATAVVERYAEPSSQDADGFANAVNAHRGDGPRQSRHHRHLRGAGFSLSVFPTNASQGVEPSFVLTPQGSEPNGGGPAAPPPRTPPSSSSLGSTSFPPSPPAPTSPTPKAPTVVHYVTQVEGRDLVGADGAPLGLAVVVRPTDPSSRPTARCRSQFESSAYPLAPFADLARTRRPRLPPPRPSRARLCPRFDDQPGVGYLEPAVLFTGAGKSVLVPAVAPAQLR